MFMKTYKQTYYCIYHPESGKYVSFGSYSYIKFNDEPVPNCLFSLLKDAESRLDPQKRKFGYYEKSKKHKNFNVNEFVIKEIELAFSVK